jgi:hypothetical protein
VFLNIYTGRPIPLYFLKAKLYMTGHLRTESTSHSWPSVMYINLSSTLWEGFGVESAYVIWILSTAYRE